LNIDDFLGWKVPPGFFCDLEKSGRVSIVGVLRRGQSALGHGQGVIHVIMNMAGFGGETRRHLQHGAKDYRNKGHKGQARFA
jgi:hypothetical protein